MRVVVNTSPLIVLERIGRLDILHRLYGQVLRPQAVLDELQAGQARHRLSTALTESDWIVTQPDPPEMVLRKELGTGETAAITLAYKIRADLVILDDLQARLVAAGLGLKITGTLGVLLAARRIGLLRKPDTVASDLIEAGFRISDELLGELTDSRPR